MKTLKNRPEREAITIFKIKINLEVLCEFNVFESSGKVTLSENFSKYMYNKMRCMFCTFYSMKT